MQPSLKQVTIQLYTRQQCSLCNYAKYFIHRIKRKYPEEAIKVEEVFIDENPALSQLYNDVIPVIMVNQKEACREKPHERLIREAVEKEMMMMQTTQEKTIEQMQLEMQQNQLKVEEMQEMEHLLRKTIFRGLRATIIFVSAMLLFFKVMKKKNEDTKTQKLKQNTVLTEKKE